MQRYRHFANLATYLLIFFEKKTHITELNDIFIIFGKGNIPTLYLFYTLYYI